MKGLLEFVVSVVLHPVAMVLAWINIAGRSDLGAVQKVLWGVVSFAHKVRQFRILFDLTRHA